MFSLRIAIILALSTRFSSNAVYGYTVALPYSSVDDQSSLDSNTLFETTTPDCDCADDPVTAAVTDSATEPPVTAYADESSSYATAQVSVVQPSLSNPGPPHIEGNNVCNCKKCSPENGCFIKHFRQYNYYYPHGRRAPVPLQTLDPIVAQEFLPSDGIPIGSSVSSMGQSYARASAKSSSKSTVRYNLPSGASYEPNNKPSNGNYVYNDQISSGIHQSAPIYSPDLTSQSTPIYSSNEISQSAPISEPIIDDQSSNNNEEHSPSSNETEEQTTEPPQDCETTTTTDPTPQTYSDDNNINEDIITYLSEPNSYGHTRMTVVKNGNSRNFKSQKVSISSRMNSQPLVGFVPPQQQVDISVESQPLTDDVPQQQVSITSTTNSPSLPVFQPQQKVAISTTIQPRQPVSGSVSQQQGKQSLTTIQSQSLPWFGPAMNWPVNTNFGGQNRMTISYNPYFQSQPFGVSPIMQLQSQQPSQQQLQLQRQSQRPLRRQSQPKQQPQPTQQRQSQSQPKPQPQQQKPKQSQSQPSLPVSAGFQNTINWLGSSTTPSQIYQPNKIQLLNPVTTWPNFPSQSTMFDITNLTPSYSVIL